MARQTSSQGTPDTCSSREAHPLQLGSAALLVALDLRVRLPDQSLLSLEPDDALDNDPRVIKTTNGRPKLGDPQFVPLADVPDNVWKSNMNFYQTIADDGKRQRHSGPGSRGQSDNPNHFADMDLPYKGSDTFLEFMLSDVKANLDPAVWIDYYKSVAPKFEAWAKALGKEPRPRSHWGALPFRVGQLYKAMREAADAGNAALFLCAGGVLIHYVGDACQPLHTSYLSQGDLDDVVDKPRSEGQKMRADGVHSGYEDDMINDGFQEEGLFDTIEQEIKRQAKDHNEKLVAVSTSKNAAELIVRLAAKTHETIQPREIVDAWVEALRVAPRQFLVDSAGLHRVPLQFAHRTPSAIAGSSPRPV